MSPWHEPLPDDWADADSGIDVELAPPPMVVDTARRPKARPDARPKTPCDLPTPPPRVIWLGEPTPRTRSINAELNRLAGLSSASPKPPSRSSRRVWSTPNGGCCACERTLRVYAAPLMISLDVDAPQLKFVELPGYRMAYREWGDPTATAALVLIHGITSSSLSWIRVAPRFAAHSRVIAVDLKGHGDSDRPATGYRLTDQAAEVAGLCRALGLANVSLIGHSWGGGIALQLAARGELPIERLVLEDPGVGQRTMTPEDIAQRQKAASMYIGSVGITREEAEARVRPNLALGWTEQDVAGKIDASIKGSPASVEAVFVENGLWNQLDLFAELRCPTLLLRAEVSRGGIVGDEAVALASANPLVKIVTVANADHNIHRGQFDAFMAEVEPFLGE